MRFASSSLKQCNSQAEADGGLQGNHRSLTLYSRERHIHSSPFCTTRYLLNLYHIFLCTLIENGLTLCVSLPHTNAHRRTQPKPELNSLFHSPSISNIYRQLEPDGAVLFLAAMTTRTEDFPSLPFPRG